MADLPLDVWMTEALGDTLRPRPGWPLLPEPASSPADRFRLAIELYDFAIRALRARLLREQPGRSAESVAAAVAEWATAGAAEDSALRVRVYHRP